MDVLERMAEMNMFKFGCVGLVAFAAACVMDPSQREPTAQEIDQRTKLNREVVNSILENRVYFQDKRAQPPVCSALDHLWIRGVDTYRMASTVPCESVKHLLVNPD
jgi:hypothetical protein